VIAGLVPAIHSVKAPGIHPAAHANRRLHGMDRRDKRGDDESGWRVRINPIPTFPGYQSTAAAFAGERVDP